MLKWFPEYGWISSPARLVIAGVITVGFAALARVLRGVDRNGMLAGGVSCFLLFCGSGPAGFAVLAALFALTWSSTRFGYRHKQDIGVAERRDGRNAWQVLANLAVPAAGSAAFAVTGNRIWLLAAVAAMAEAATDTVASEVGQASSQTSVLITSWKRVPAGVDGGITIPGTMAGMAAGLMVSGVAAWGRMILPTQLWIPVMAGFAGMLTDSVLGATVQRRGRLSNEAVNFFSTLAAASLAAAVSAAS